MLIFELADESTVTPATIYKATDESEVGERIEIMGWGAYGPEGRRPQIYGEFHAGENRVEDIWNGMLMYKLSDPADADSGALEKEVLAYDGDSGSPAFIDVNGEQQIAGLNSFGECCNYGHRDFYTRLGGVSYDWIKAVIEENTAHDESGNCPAYPTIGFDLDESDVEDAIEMWDKDDDKKLTR